MKNTSFRRSLARNLHTLAFWIEPTAKRHYKAVIKTGQINHLQMNLVPVDIESINPPENVENNGNPVPASVEQADGKENEPSVAVVQEEQKVAV